jgi:hypothetical protein
MTVDAMHVVLCHAVDDHARADALPRALRAEGVQVWSVARKLARRCHHQLRALARRGVHHRMSIQR